MSNNEEIVEQTLNQYKNELSVVISALNYEQKNNDLIELRDKLEEIIALTEVDLIRIKKERLLLELNSQLNCNSDNEESTTSEPNASTSSASFTDNSESNGINSSLIDSLTELNGKECRVGLSEPNGSVILHNAVIMTNDAIDSIDDSCEPNESSIKIKVFFTYPMNNWMLSCPHYMSGKCRYLSDKCKYSHGYEVSLADIKPFEPIDYSSVGRDSVCLAKNKLDGLWYKAVVDDIQQQKIVVKYIDSEVIDSLDIEEILPFSDSWVEFDTKCDINLNESLNDVSDDCDEVPVIAWNTSSASMAEWEVHTKGIGSKLLTKMGYVWGQGLGRNGEGITQPIEAFVFPNAKSLDKCIELKEKFLSKDELKEKIKSNAKQKAIERRIANGYNKESKDSVFDFINNKVFAKKDNSSDISKIDSNHKSITPSELKTSNTQSLNISSLKISEDIRKAEFELKRLNDSMVRNKSRDKTLYTQLELKVDKQNQLIRSLKQKEVLIQRELNSRSNKQKLRVF